MWSWSAAWRNNTEKRREIFSGVLAVKQYDDSLSEGG
jgi:hypothetical protein